MFECQERGGEGMGGGGDEANCVALRPFNSNYVHSFLVFIIAIIIIDNDYTFVLYYWTAMNWIADTICLFRIQSNSSSSRLQSFLSSFYAIQCYTICYMYTCLAFRLMYNHAENNFKLNYIIAHINWLIFIDRTFLFRPFCLFRPMAIVYDWDNNNNSYNALHIMVYLLWK